MTVPYDILTPIGLVFCFLLLLVCVAWILLPFAVFGIKRRIDRTTQAVYEVGLILQRRLPPPAPGSPDLRFRPEEEDEIFSAGK